MTNLNINLIYINPKYIKKTEKLYMYVLCKISNDSTMLAS
jgi:hypothetical protein